MIQRCVVKFNTDGASIVPDQYVIMGSTVKKPINPVKKGYRFNNWSLDLLGFKIPFSFNIPILTNITLYATWVKNTPKSASVIKVYAPITHFSVIKNKTVKFKYVVLYSNNKIVNKTKKIKYKKIGKKKLTLKYKNKKLKLVIRVANKKVKPNGIKIIKVKSKKLYFLKIKSKDAAYYQFPKFNGKSKINKYGIYKIKKQTVKIKWWGKSFKKKI
jgi:uncharacterized repeat protein (TIGR02543 family)